MPDADPLNSPPALAPPPPRRKRRWPRFLLKTAAFLFLLLAIAAVVGVFWLRSAEYAALPVLDGDLHLAGLTAPVTVRRDAHGVPHIEAANEDDLFFAQGYVTAQDRLWQMDALRRNANGELAEIMGPSLLRHDRFQRTYQFRNTARRIYANLAPADRTRLDDYARGVNLFIAQHQDNLPAEFKLLFYRPQPWSGADSMSIVLQMCETLDTHWYAKYFREKIAARLHNPKLEADLYPVGSWRDHPPTGTVVDWSQPHPAPPGTATDEDDDRTQTRLAPAPKEPNAVKRHDFSRVSMGVRPTQGDENTEAGCPRSLAFGDRGVHEPTFVCSSLALDRAAMAIESTWASADEGFLHPVPSEISPLSAARASQAGAAEVAGDDLPSGLRTLIGLPACDGCNPGSNNWVIAGQHTASGRPLLSNDMHLGLTEPNIWFMADLRAPGFHATGVTLPGMPFVVAGHNEHVAWGITALYADVQDLYLERLDGKGNFQAADGTWKPLTLDHETIHVRGARDVELDLPLTAHGPLVNWLFKDETRPMSLAWTIYDPSVKALPLYPMNVASNWDEFSAALKIWPWPTLNMVYSDDKGHIAYHAVGWVPVRPGGMAGVPIQDANHEWKGYVPYDDMPSAVDPPSGFLATANSRVTTENSSYPLALEWGDPYRAERIYKSLQGREQLTPKDLLAVQIDIYSEVNQELGHRFAYAIDHTSGVDDRLRKAADLMRSWDGRLTTDSVAASIVTQARDAFWPMILKPKLGEDYQLYMWSEKDFAEEEIVMHGSSDWLPKDYKNWDALLTDAVRKGMKQGKAPADLAQWTYGSWHVVDIEHPLAQFLPWISSVAGTGEQPLSGDSTTVKQVQRDFGPSQRFTMDWTDIDNSTENIVLGESGDPYSAYFRDQWSDYYAGTTFALPFSEVAVAGQTRHTLRLLP
jgi:penicillin amidase